jgi:hypothetical protein
MWSSLSGNFQALNDRELQVGGIRRKVFISQIKDNARPGDLTHPFSVIKTESHIL